MSDNYIFDSLTYADGDLDTLIQSMDGTLVSKACVLSRIDQDHIQHLNAIQSYPNLYPVISIDPQQYDKAKLEEYSKLGAVAIKLHPRFGKFAISDPRLQPIIQDSQDLGLAIMICSYRWGAIDGGRFLEDIYNLVASHPQAKFIMMHAGAVELLSYIELARAFKNILLDLSMTILKYPGSSLDMDLRFAFQQFDRRICIGSDYPEYNAKKLSGRYLELSQGVDKDKLELISHSNLENFLGIS